MSSEGDGDGGSDESDTPSVGEFDWLSREILKALHEVDGTADSSEVKTRTGVKYMGSINHRLDEKLVPNNLVDVMKQETDEGRPQPRVFSLTPTGTEVAGMIAEVESSDDEDGLLPLDQRLDRLEAAIESDFGNWSLDRQEEFRITFQMMRVIRDYLAERDGDEFRNYVDENFNLDDLSE